MPRQARAKMAEVHTTPPWSGLGQALGAQLGYQCRRGDEDGLRGPVEPPYEAPEPCRGQFGAFRQIGRELGVIGGGELKVVRDAPAPSSDPQRSFGRNVQRVWCERLDPLADGTTRGESKTDFRIGRAG